MEWVCGVCGTHIGRCGLLLLDAAPTLVEFGLTGCGPPSALLAFRSTLSRVRRGYRMHAELAAQLAEVRSGGLTSAGTAERSTDGEDAASASITTLEGETMLLRMDLGGVRITERINPADGDGGPSTPPTMVYDCVSSLLLNTSAGYKAHFNSSLFAALSKVAAEREAEEAAEEEAEANADDAPSEGG